MNRQLTVQESRHRLARKICHGNRGQIRQAYREGQEDQLVALGLVLNAVVLWNTRYLNVIIEELRAKGPTTREDDVARLPPLGHAPPELLGPVRFHHPAGRRVTAVAGPVRDRRHRRRLVMIVMAIAELPIVYAETRQLAEEWTYPSLVAAHAHRPPATTAQRSR